QRCGGGRCKLPRVFRAARFGHTEMIVAIDGPAGAGKSTVAQRLAERLGALAADNPVTFDERGRVWIADTDVTSSIRKSEIDRMVPVVARKPQVREVMRVRQRELADDGSV